MPLRIQEQLQQSRKASRTKSKKCKRLYFQISSRQIFLNLTLEVDMYESPWMVEDSRNSLILSIYSQKFKVKAKTFLTIFCAYFFQSFLCRNIIDLKNRREALRNPSHIIHQNIRISMFIQEYPCEPSQFKIFIKKMDRKLKWTHK